MRRYSIRLLQVNDIDYVITDVIIDVIENDIDNDFVNVIINDVDYVYH